MKTIQITSEKQNNVKYFLNIQQKVAYFSVIEKLVYKQCKITFILNQYIVSSLSQSKKKEKKKPMSVWSFLKAGIHYTTFQIGPDFSIYRSL